MEEFLDESKSCVDEISEKLKRLEGIKMRDSAHFFSFKNHKVYSCKHGEPIQCPAKEECSCVFEAADFETVLYKGSATTSLCKHQELFTCQYSPVNGCEAKIEKKDLLLQGFNFEEFLLHKYMTAGEWDILCNEIGDIKNTLSRLWHTIDLIRPAKKIKYI